MEDDLAGDYHYMEDYREEGEKACAMKHFIGIIIKTGSIVREE